MKPSEIGNIPIVDVGSLIIGIVFATGATVLLVCRERVVNLHERINPSATRRNVLVSSILAFITAACWVAIALLPHGQNTSSNTISGPVNLVIVVLVLMLIGPVSLVDQKWHALARLSESSRSMGCVHGLDRTLRRPGSDLTLFVT